MSIFFTADHHFGHKNIIEYAHRPFKSVEEMDAVMIERWNMLVDTKDLVYVIGDFTLKDVKYALKILDQLQGQIRILPGSHDSWMKDFDIGGRIRFLPPLYSMEVESPYIAHKGEKQMIVLCHYPMRSWDASHFKSWHLFGHHHGTLPPYGLSFDVGVDCFDFKPVELDVIGLKMLHLKPIEDYTMHQNGRKR